MSSRKVGKFKVILSYITFSMQLQKTLLLCLKRLPEKLLKLPDKDVGQKPEEVKQANIADAGNQSEISISADEATNALLIFAPADAFKTLDQIISDLDVPRMQVYVEALVMEVSLTKSLDLGINWKAAGATNSNRVITGGFPGGGAFTGDATTGGTAAVAADSATIGVLNGNTISMGGREFFSFGAFVKAVQDNNDVNVLANPQLMISITLRREKFRTLTLFQLFLSHQKLSPAQPTFPQKNTNSRKLVSNLKLNRKSVEKKQYSTRYCPGIK